jgi:hypothetical protein
MTMMQKGRYVRPEGLEHMGGPKGERAPFAKLTADQVREIRLRVDAGEMQTSLAKDFGVSKSAINLIIKRKSWAHIA